MDAKYSHSDLFLEIADMGWFDKRQGQLWVFGTEWKRHRRTEILLRRLTQRKKKGLTAIRYGNKLIYTLRKRGKNIEEAGSDTYHSLNCMECSVRFYVSDTDCEVIPEKHFRGCGSVADGGFRYPNDTLLCFEFSTKSNVLFHELIEGKLRAYDRNLENIEKKFQAKAMVVFILAIPRDQVQRKIERWKPDGPYYFTDYQTFLRVPKGQALTAPIYFYTDGKEYPLKKNV